EGNDRFYVQSTNPNVIVQLVGGLGSDTFNVGGSGGNPITVVANGLQGHSGLIGQTVTSSDPNFNGIFVQGISAHVADNEAAGVVIDAGNQGILRVFESTNQALTGLVVNSYTVFLTRAPEENVRVTAAPVAISERDR